MIHYRPPSSSQDEKCQTSHYTTCHQSILTLHSGFSLTDPTKYCTILGIFQYMSLIRPNIAYTLPTPSINYHNPCIVPRLTIGHPPSVSFVSVFVAPLIMVSFFIETPICHFMPFLILIKQEIKMT